MHRLGTVALCGLLVLAGCSAVPGGGPDDPGGPTPTLTPAPVPEPTEAPEELAPGLTTDGVTDPLALANAHGEALGARYRFTSNWTVRYPNGTVFARADQSATVTPDAFVARVAAVGRPGFITSGAETTAVFWSNRTALATRVERDGRVSYRYADGVAYADAAGFYTSLRRPRPWLNHYALFSSVETRTVGRVDGAPTRYRVVGETLRDPATFGATSGLRRATNVSLEAIVSERGIVRSLHLSYSGRLPEGERVRVTRRIIYRSDAPEVTRPAWFDRAVNDSREARNAAARRIAAPRTGLR
ncbi:hypothetical protein [Haloglomus litoreum]|uniref:hypothetical protein n=1 Tax=Haloglomus litoreum TaxID=3034026 RepID=UPI0023E7714F|nr:hypothetical protein [Haloglomus sp. DT116]